MVVFARRLHAGWTPITSPVPPIERGNTCSGDDSQIGESQYGHASTPHSMTDASHGSPAFSCWGTRSDGTRSIRVVELPRRVTKCRLENRPSVRPICPEGGRGPRAMSASDVRHRLGAQ